MAVEPGHRRGDRLVVVGRRAHPRRRPLEHEQLPDVGGDLRDELHRARRRCRSPRPACRRGRSTGPTAPSGRPGPRRSRSRGSSWGGWAGSAGRPRSPPRRTPPPPHGRRPSGRVTVQRRSSSDQTADTTSVAEPDPVPQPERVRAVAEVLLEHRLGRVVERPVVALRERVAVGVVRVVDATARVAVLVPGAADVVVLLEDDVLAPRPAAGGGPRAGPTCRRR